MKRVLLVDGNGMNYGTDSTYRFEGAGITPFGLARLQGYLEMRSVPTTLVHLRDHQDAVGQEVLDRLVASHDIVGVSALSMNIDGTFAFCRRVKSLDPQKLIVGGAEHIALDDAWILTHPSLTGIDAACTGEGQIPLYELACGLPIEQIGGLSYARGGEIVRNPRYARLTERVDAGDERLRPAPATSLPLAWNRMIFPEMTRHFQYCGSTQTGSGCAFDCTFCSNGPFMGARYEPLLETATKEVETLAKEGIDFVFFRDAILNAQPTHFASVIDMMRRVNVGQDQQMGWFGFLSAIRGEPHRRFADMAAAGCVMIGVGLEDVIGNRKSLGKGASVSVAVDFVDVAKEHVLVRTLLILGLPEHYRYSREELKARLLGFMKSHPQGLFRINQWTPLVGTADFASYQDALLVDPRKDIAGFRQFDTMHNVIDPSVMYDRLGVPSEQRWIKDANDWLVFRREIITEYLNSAEHAQFLETLKGKVSAGRLNLLHDIATAFRTETLANPH